MVLAPALVLGTGACGGTPTAQKTEQSSAVAVATTTFSCTNPQRTSMVQGDPDISAVPSVSSVSLVPSVGGLVVSFKFRVPFVLAPEGVYFSWTVYVFRHRSDASNPEGGVELQVEDRGEGWEPTGWTIIASTYTQDKLVSGDVHTDKARDEIAAVFPAGFADLQPPFYWFASQVAFRAYLPRGKGGRDWSINGSLTNDCPAGVRHDPNSLPYGAKLLAASA